MTTNEAPEKLWWSEGAVWHTNPNSIRYVEYVRKDAFVEKAKKWFEKQNEWRDINDIKHCDMESFENFIQYVSIESGIKAHAEDYSFNIESELFNQLTKEQQALWRKEIEQACISGGYCGLNLGLDKRYDKEEPVSNDFEMALAEMIDKAQKCVVEPWVVAAQWKDYLIKLAKSEEPVSEELGGYINELSKQFPEVSFAKLSRIAVRAAKWQKQKDEKAINENALLYNARLEGIEIGKAEMKQQMMAKAIDAEVKVDAGGYPYIDKTIELYDYDKDEPLAKEGDKYKVVLIKEE